MSVGSNRAGDADKRAPKLGLWLTVFVGCCFAVLIVFPASFVVICAGMAPTVVAVLAEGNKGPHALSCTATLNFAGVLPVLTILWERGSSFSAAIGLLQDGFMWAMMYGGAGIAMFLLWLLPTAMRAWSEAVARHNRRVMEREQQSLTKEWGEQIAEDAAAAGGGRPATDPGDAR